jgi:hypothetical protein
MKFKYVQTRLVRYTVVIEAPDMDTADDKVLLHEEWCEDGVEEEDPPWREECPEDALPDLFIVGGYAIPTYNYLRPELTPPMLDCEGRLVTAGARVKYQRGTFAGAPWFPGTVTYLYAEYDCPTHALVEDDDKDIKSLKHGSWVGSARLALLTEEEQVPVFDDDEEEYDEEECDEGCVTVTVSRHTGDIAVELCPTSSGWCVVAALDENSDEVELTDEELEHVQRLADDGIDETGR